MRPRSIRPAKVMPHLSVGTQIARIPSRTHAEYDEAAAPGDRIKMSTDESDALVFYGATGDLAYKKIFPALQAMVKRGNLKIPVIGVAKNGWNLAQLKARARDSVEKHGGLDESALNELMSRLQYIDGDYGSPETFAQLRSALGGACRPAHYLA